MKLLRVVEVNENGSTDEPVNHECYHPLQIKELLNGNRIEPICCAVEYEYDSVLREICVALGWQGGTIHQAIEEIKRLKRMSDDNNK